MIKQTFLDSIPLTAVMSPVEKTWIVFEKSKGPRRWYHRFCHPKRQHCWILHYDGWQWWRYERTYSGLSYRQIIMVGNVVFDQACDISWFYRTNHHMFEVPRMMNIDKLDISGEMRSFPLEFSTCVQYVLDFSGMNSFWIYTPEMLYRHLKKQCTKSPRLYQDIGLMD